MAAGKVVAPLTKAEWPQLFAMMQAQNFPDVPHCYADAARAFAEVTVLGVWQGASLLGAFVVGEQQTILEELESAHNSACFFMREKAGFVDVVCAQGQEGKWLNRDVLRQVKRFCFEEQGYGVLWAHCYRLPSLRLAFKLGFRALANQLQEESPVLMLRQSWIEKALRE